MLQRGAPIFPILQPSCTRERSQKTRIPFSSECVMAAIFPSYRSFCTSTHSRKSARGRTSSFSRGDAPPSFANLPARLWLVSGDALATAGPKEIVSCKAASILLVLIQRRTVGFCSCAQTPQIHSMSHADWLCALFGRRKARPRSRSWIITRTTSRGRHNGQEAQAHASW
jgi:hypothetical protein